MPKGRMHSFEANCIWLDEGNKMENENRSSDIQHLQIHTQQVTNEGILYNGSYRVQFFEETKKQLWLAGPLIAVSLLQYFVQVVSILFVGHLGELPLSSASLATSFASVTGFSILLGMGSALETLCGQSYGAEQYHMVGVYTQRAMLILVASCIPLSLIWFYTTDILILCGQDLEISTGAGSFNRWMIPSLFAYGLLQCLNRFLQTQNIVYPMMICSGITVVLHVLLCWVTVYKLGIGIKGAAIANNISYWINVFLLTIYTKMSLACKKTWVGFSKEALSDLLSFLKLAVPSAIMICLEYWLFEMVVLLSGLLPNPKLETSVLSISLNTCWMVYMVSVGLGGAIRSEIEATLCLFFCIWNLQQEKRNNIFLFSPYSTRVSNELGAGNPLGARFALLVMVTIAISEGLVVATITVLIRHIWGKLYSNVDEVIVYVAKMMPLLALSDFLDGFQCVLSGAARGCGWQKTCVVINVAAYYLVALPFSLLFAFVLHIGGRGLWMGIICGLIVQIIGLIIVNLRTNWDRETRNIIISHHMT